MYTFSKMSIESKDRITGNDAFRFRKFRPTTSIIMTARSVTTQSKMSLEEEQQLIEGQTSTHFSDVEEVREREIRVHQALSMLKSTNFTWCQSPIKILQNKLGILGLDWTVFEENPILFCIFKQRLSGKFSGNLAKYKPFLSLINQRHCSGKLT